MFHLPSSAGASVVLAVAAIAAGVAHPAPSVSAVPVVTIAEPIDTRHEGRDGTAKVKNTVLRTRTATRQRAKKKN